MSEPVAIRPPTQPFGTWYVSSAAEEKKSVVAGVGMLDYLEVANTTASVKYVWVYDNTAASGTALRGPFPVPANGATSFDLPQGIPFSTGVYVASSSTFGTYTGTTTADLIITCHYTKRPA